jgi:hypothetical protein
MPTYEPAMDYATNKTYRLRLDPKDLLGGTYNQGFDPKSLYRKATLKDFPELDSAGGRYKPEHLVIYARVTPYFGDDSLTRTERKYQGNPSLQPDMVAARRALKQV